MSNEYSVTCIITVNKTQAVVKNEVAKVYKVCNICATDISLYNLNDVHVMDVNKIPQDFIKSRRKWEVYVSNSYIVHPKMTLDQRWQTFSLCLEAELL